MTRRVDVLKAVSEATGMPLVAPTGVYREPWIPPWVHAADAGRLRDHMVGELLEGIETKGRETPLQLDIYRDRGYM